MAAVHNPETLSDIPVLLVIFRKKTRGPDDWLKALRVPQGILPVFQEWYGGG
jgi:hypothetical protein